MMNSRLPQPCEATHTGDHSAGVSAPRVRTTVQAIAGPTGRHHSGRAQQPASRPHTGSEAGPEHGHRRAYRRTTGGPSHTPANRQSRITGSPSHTSQAGPHHRHAGLHHAQAAGPPTHTTGRQPTSFHHLLCFTSPFASHHSAPLAACHTPAPAAGWSTGPPQAAPAPP